MLKDPSATLKVNCEAREDARECGMAKAALTVIPTLRRNLTGRA